MREKPSLSYFVFLAVALFIISGALVLGTDKLCTAAAARTNTAVSVRQESNESAADSLISVDGYRDWLNEKRNSVSNGWLWLYPVFSLITGLALVYFFVDAKESPYDEFTDEDEN